MGATGSALTRRHAPRRLLHTGRNSGTMNLVRNNDTQRVVTVAPLGSSFVRHRGTMKTGRLWRTVAAVAALAASFAALYLFSTWFGGHYWRVGTGGSEAPMNLARLADLSETYFRTHGQLPSESTPVTPGWDAHASRCANGAGSRARMHTPAAVWRSDDTWRALEFVTDEDLGHAFSYRYEVARVEDDWQFTASAFGDLDCDGRYSTFVRMGWTSDGGAEWHASDLQASDELE